ncbi:MAG TPA: VCBS repeat-containing protein, partial [Nocardioides sp.]|nr:VCBS repeat-containing protein [Nocardioides sp.]
DGADRYGGGGKTGDGDSPSAAGSADSSGGSSDSPGPGSAGAPGPIDGPIAPADVNGDGFDDTILLDDVDDETVVLLSDPDSASGFGDQQRWSSSAYGDALVVRGDFTGDGWADLALAEPGLVRVAASNGTRFRKATSWATPDLPAKFKVTAGDFNADGKDDLAFLTGAGTGAISIEVALADGNAFRAPEPWAGIDGWNYDDMRIGAADVNGDGRADLVELGKPPEGGIDIRVFASVAGSGTFDGTFDANALWFQDPDWSWETTRLSLGDVDADGDADVMALRDVGGLEVDTLLSDGSGAFDADDFPIAITDLAFDRTRSVVADTDGDGTTDLVLVDRDTSEARRYARTSGGFSATGSTSVDAHVDEDGSILVGVSR